MLKTLGWVLMVAGVLAFFIGQGQLRDAGHLYGPTAASVERGLWLIWGGGASAHLGFFFVMFGWLGEKIDGLKLKDPPAG